MKPFFSVIIAVYNREFLITRALESLLNQDFKNWEAIIIDDCSTDMTLNSVKPFLSDKRLELISTETNSGVAKARNIGIKESTGNFITFLDSDDEYKSNHLKSRYNLLKNSEIDLLHGGVEIIGDNFVPDKNDLTKMIKLKDCVIGGTFFINSSLNERLKLFDETTTYSEDSKMFEIFEQNDLQITKTSLKTYIYHRDSEDSICNSVER